MAATTLAHCTATSSSTCPPGSPAPTAPSCSPTAAPRSSRSSRRRVIRCGGGRRRAPRSQPASDGALFGFLAGSKHSVVADPDADDDVELVNALLADADAVVWSRGSTVAEHAAFTPARSTASHPHLTVTSITPFGLDGPWRDRPATEFTLQAWSGGIVGLGRGSADRAPVFVGGQVGEWLAGAYAAPRRWRRGCGHRDRRGELVDLSMLEAQILCLTYYPVTYFEMLGRPWRDARRLTVPGRRAAPRTAWSASGAAPRSSGSTSARWSATPSGSTRIAAVDHRAGQREGRRDLRVGSEPQPSTRSATWRRPSGSPTRRSPTAPTSPSSTTSRRARSFVANPATASVSPGHPTGCSRRMLRPPQPAPRLGEHTEQYRRSRDACVRESARSTGQASRTDCRSSGLAGAAT